jgi:multidrug efflux pump subunit AcrB
MLLAVNLISPNGTYDARFLQNYGDIHITDALSRIPGVAQITNFGLSKYAMRIWLDPARLTNLGLTAMDVENAIKEQNQQVATGKVGQAPAPARQAVQYQLNTLAPLAQVSQFEDIIVRANPGGSVVHIRDVARVERGAEEYDWETKLSGKPTATIIVFQLAEANGLQIKAAVTETMNKLAKHFPDDMQWVMRYDTTLFITESIKEVIVTLLEAVALVVVVVFVFPAKFSGGSDSHHCCSGITYRRLCLHENFRLFHQFPEHAGNGSGGGPGGGRCYCGGGKRHAQARGGREERY